MRDVLYIFILSFLISCEKGEGLLFSQLASRNISSMASSEKLKNTLTILPSKIGLSFYEDETAQEVHLFIQNHDPQLKCEDFFFFPSPLVVVELYGMAPHCIAKIRPLKNQNGFDTLIYSVKDITTTTQGLSINIRAVEDPPVISLSKDAIEFEEDGGSKEIEITISDVDTSVGCSDVFVDGGQLVSASLFEEGELCKARITPLENKSGNDFVKFTVYNGIATSINLPVSILKVEDPPVISLDKSSLSFKEDGLAQVVALTISDVDSEVDCSQISVKGNSGLIYPVSVVGTGASCSANILPRPDRSGNEVIHFVIDNGMSSSDELSISVTEVDDPPELTLDQSTLNFIENGPSQVTNLSISDQDSLVSCSQIKASGATYLFEKISFSGTGNNCSAGLIPNKNTSGSGFLTFTVQNSHSTSIQLKVIVSGVVNPPSLLSLIDPEASPGTSPTPTIRLSGVRIGDTIKLYKDSSCTMEVASGIATGSTIDLTTSPLMAGYYQFYANSRNSIPTISKCSSTSASYILNVDGNLSFEGITSITNKSDSAITLNWSSHPGAVSYGVYNTLSKTPVLLKTVVGQYATSITLTGLIPFSTYRFRVRMKTSAGFYDSNTNDYTVTMNGAPGIPTGLTLINPTSSKGGVANPTIRVSGVKDGDTIKIFTDHSCQTEVASGVATGSTIDLTTVPLPKGTYHFYANASNSLPASSSCSSAAVSYIRNPCPNNYVSISKNPTLGLQSDFCVAKHEMKNVNGKPLPLSEGTPWVDISPGEAKTACESLGKNYDLISNPEWMALSFEIESNKENWTEGEVGRGGLYRGHTDGYPKYILSGSTDSDPYFETGNSADSEKEQRRTFVASSGEVLWDVSGNAWEWVNWTIDNNLTYPSKHCQIMTWSELKTIKCRGVHKKDYLPLNPVGIKEDLYNSSLGLGKFMASSDGTPTPALRGGKWNLKTASGIYSLYWNPIKTTAHPDVGFRCVYRP
jgi:hypothetical protein